MQGKMLMILHLRNTTFSITPVIMTRMIMIARYPSQARHGQQDSERPYHSGGDSDLDSLAGSATSSLRARIPKVDSELKV